MAKSIAKSCPLCLSVNDPADMLPVTMEHSTPPQSAPMYLCRRCVIQIMKSTLESDVVDPKEVFGAARAGDPGGTPSGDCSDITASADPLVLSTVAKDEGPGIDRREPEVPAGGEDRGAKD